MGVAATVAACDRPGTVNPGEHEVLMRHDGSESYTIDVRLVDAAPSYRPVDVLFLFDTTGSMKNVIEDVRANAREIMSDIRAMNAEAAFALAGFHDYDDSGPVWQLYQDVTTDIAGVRRGLAAIRLFNGGDWPEAYSRALDETRHIGWRDGAQRFVILFGDAPAHDPSFYGADLGADPGRDRTPGTADDLRLENVVQELAAAKITVVAIYDRGEPGKPKPFLEETLEGFEFMASETGGVVKEITASDGVTEAIKGMWRELPKPTPNVVVPPEARSWIDVRPMGAGGGDLHRFLVSVKPPEGAAAGVHDFSLAIFADDPHGAGALIGKSDLIVRLGWMAYPWFWPVVLAYMLLASLLLFLVLKGRDSHPRLERGGQGVNLAWRAAVLLLMASGLLAIAVYLPSTPGDMMDVLRRS